MAEKKSTLLFAAGNEAQQKFDYFIAAVTGAIFAYVAQTYKPRILGLNPESLEPLALAFLAISFFIGLKRIEAVFISMRHNFESLSASEAAGSMTEAIGRGIIHGYDPESGEIIESEQFHAKRERYMRKAQAASHAFDEVSTGASRYYRLRNYFLYAGFTALFFAKLLSPYFGTTKVLSPAVQSIDPAPKAATSPQK